MTTEANPRRVEPREELRARLLRAFEARLDEALAAPELPAGLAAELLDVDSGAQVVADTHPHAAELDASSEGSSSADAASASDLYSVFAAVTALTQEVKLQGRSFKELTERIDPIARDASLLSDTAAHLERVIAAQVGQARDATQRERIELLLDLRERLARGDSAGRELLDRFASLPRPGLFERHSSARIESLHRATRALAEGCALALAELDEALTQLGVARIDCVGKAFDPHRMQAIALEASDTDEGRVLEVHREGYEWGDAVLRTAQVKVASRAAPGRAQPPE